MGLFGFGKKKETAPVVSEKTTPVIENPAQKAFEEKQKELNAIKELGNELRSQFESHSGLLVADYQELTIEQDTNIRKFFRENDIKFRVFKNEAAQAAVTGTVFEDASKFFTGRVGTVFFDTQEQLDLISDYLTNNPMGFEIKYSKFNGELDVFKK